ncbi:MAG TPA: Zn-ribbon domain-containing OB-fold protein [Methylomirabilota bacterium]|nr:Zn-ribbon domain-containing OB-fold protein [Methylomirabilota bacterium]
MADPVVTLKHFFEEARSGRLTGIRCRRCGDLAMPPKEFCPACQERDWAPVALAGAGNITSFTVIRVAPRGRAAEVPYAVAVVRLDEGVSLLGRIVDISLESLRIGLPVRFRPLVTSEQAAIGFGPA